MSSVQHPTFGWKSLPMISRFRLGLEDESLTVGAKLRPARGSTHLKVFRKDVGWVHIVLDENLAIIAYGKAKHETVAYEQAKSQIELSERDTTS